MPLLKVVKVFVSFLSSLSFSEGCQKRGCKYALACTLVLQVVLVNRLLAQSDSLPKFAVEGYAEFYFSHDFAKNATREKPNFFSNHKRIGELNANLIMLKASQTQNRYRFNLGVMAGNYAQYNLAHEPIWAQFVYEANMGIKLSSSHNLWLDAGIMPSHIGFESPIGADSWNLTRSILAENSPYYESGIRLSYASLNKKWQFALLGLNGWQTITLHPLVKSPSLGLQVMHKTGENNTVNYSYFLGQVFNKGNVALRQYHNFFLQYKSNRGIGIIFGFDLGTEQAQGGKLHSWYSPVLILRTALVKQWFLAIRTEYFHDPEQVIFVTGRSKGFRTMGYTANIDYELNSLVKLRMEGKLFRTQEKIFSGTSNQAIWLTASACIRFSR